MKSFPPRLWLALCVGALPSVLLRPQARAAIDFTPRTLEREDDGYRKTFTYLVTAPGQRALVTPPAGWTLTGGPAGLETHPPDGRGSSVALRPSPFGLEPPAFDAKGLELYRRRALAEVPPGATAVQIVEERSEPLGCFGWKTHEMVVAWELGGQPWQESIFFVTLGPREAMLGTAAGPKTAFPVLREGLLRLLSSWCRETGN